MTKNISKIILRNIVIICILIIIGFGLYYLITYFTHKENFRLNFVTAIKENFEDTLPTNTTTTAEEESIMAQTPDSAFKFKNYYLENPPTQSAKVRTEFSNMLPEGVLTGDFNVSTDNKFNISRIDTSGSQIDEYTLKSYGLETNDRSLRLSMQDETNKNKAFEIWGASCKALEDCTKPGIKLHKLTDKPSQEIYGYGGNLIHKLDEVGVAHHGGVNINNGKHIMNPSGNQYTDGVVSAKDVNIRGRLYFSQAGNDENPRSVAGNRFRPVHNSDPFYIEKIIDNAPTGTSHSTLKIVMEDDTDGNDKIEIRSGPNGNKKIMTIRNNGSIEIEGSLSVNGRNI